MFVLINLEGLAAKLRRRRANHGFGTVRILNRVMIELIRLQPTDDHTGHKKKTGADQIASIKAVMMQTDHTDHRADHI